MAVTWDQATWDAAYRIRIRDPNHPQFGQVLGYSRLGMARALDPYTDTLDLYAQRWAKLLESFPIQAGDRVLIAGCGYGFLIEAAHDAGYANVWGIDNSDYIIANRNTEARGDVLFVEADLRGGGQVRAALRNLTGDDEFRWVISEDVLTGYALSELPQLYVAAEGVLENGQPTSHIIHMVTEAPVDNPFTALTLEQWKATRPPHTFVSIRLSEWRVL